MESFEQVAKVFFEARGYVVTSNVKFPVRKQTRKAAYAEFQEHGYEIDLVGARAGSLVLASVKSYLGSTGVHPQGFKGLADETKTTHFNRFTLFNDADVRAQVMREPPSSTATPWSRCNSRSASGSSPTRTAAGKRRSGST